MDFLDFVIAAGYQMLMLWALGTVVSKLIPNWQSFCDKIELGKKILKFIGEAPEWVNYNQNLEDSIRSLKVMMQSLRSVQQDIECEVEMQELQNNGQVRREVANWLKNVNDKAKDVETLERDMEQTRRLSRFLFRAWLGSCVEKKKNEIKELLDQRGAFGPELVINANHAGRDKLVLSTLVGQVTVQRKEEIWGHLIRREVTILGVVGDQGMGKSAVMKHIYNLVLDNSRLFDSAFYVNINGENSVYELQAAIGRELRLQYLQYEDNELRRAAIIHRVLKLYKRFVFILDGLGSPFQLEEVGIPRNNGGKLVIITRYERVCRIMRCQPVIRLDRLPDGDSRELFMETLNPSADLSSDIEEIADAIILRCKGVPSSIIEASESLRNVDNVHEWRMKLSEM